MRQEANDSENSIGGLRDLSRNLREVRADGGATTAAPSRSATEEPTTKQPPCTELRVQIADELGIEGYDPARTRDPPPYLAPTRREVAVALTDLDLERACLMNASEVTQYVRDELLEGGNERYESWRWGELKQLLELARENGGGGA